MDMVTRMHVLCYSVCCVFITDAQHLYICLYTVCMHILAVEI